MDCHAYYAKTFTVDPNISAFLLMKLCIVGNPNTVHVRRWLRYFSPRHDVYFFGVQPPDGPPPEGVRFFDLTSITYVRKIRYVVWSVELRRQIAQIKPDVVHAHWVSGAGWIGAASRFHPFMVTIHGSDLMVLPKQSLIARILAKWVLSRADYVTCVSERLYEEALAYGVNPEKLELAGLGVDTSVFQPAANPANVRSKLGLGEGPVIASIRAMKSIYNPIDIALSIPLVLERIPKARFIVLTYNANSDLLSKFKAAVQAGGANDVVIYIDELADDASIAQIYQVADVCISVASSDGTPISVQEAMACGIPVVLGDIPALKAWARHGQEALLIPLHDVDKLANAVVSLIEDSNLRHRLSLAGREYVCKYADSNMWLKRGEKIYQMLASNPVSS